VESRTSAHLPWHIPSHIPSNLRELAEFSVRSGESPVDYQRTPRVLCALRVISGPCGSSTGYREHQRNLRFLCVHLLSVTALVMVSVAASLSALPPDAVCRVISQRYKVLKTL